MDITIGIKAHINNKTTVLHYPIIVAVNWSQINSDNNVTSDQQNCFPRRVSIKLLPLNIVRSFFSLLLVVWSLNEGISYGSGQEVADPQSLSESNDCINSPGATNCHGCIDSAYSDNCNNCVRSPYSRDCNGCSDSEGSRYCDHCTRSPYAAYCKRCNNCPYSQHCANQNDCRGWRHIWTLFTINKLPLVPKIVAHYEFFESMGCDLQSTCFCQVTNYQTRTILNIHVCPRIHVAYRLIHSPIHGKTPLILLTGKCVSTEINCQSHRQLQQQLLYKQFVSNNRSSHEHLSPAYKHSSTSSIGTPEILWDFLNHVPIIWRSCSPCHVSIKRFIQ